MSTFIRETLAIAVLLALASVGLILRPVAQNFWAPTNQGIEVLLALFLGYCLVTSLLGLLLFRPNRFIVMSRRSKILFMVAASLALALGTALTPDVVDLRADRDEALEGAVRNLTNGTSPWSTGTQLSVEHLPTVQLGGILVATPFVHFFGDIKWMQVIVFILTLILLTELLGLAQASLFTFFITSAPITWNEAIFQSDIWVWSLLMLLLFIAALKATENKVSSLWFWVTTGALLGVAATSRYIFILGILPVVVWILREIRGRRPRLVLLFALCVTTLVLVLVPYIFDANNRNSLSIALSKAHNSSFSLFSITIATILLSTIILLSFIAQNKSQVLACVSFGMAIPILWQALGAWIASGNLDLSNYELVFYNTAFLYPGLMSVVLATLSPRRPRCESLH